jgi:hypothetical protein
MVEALQAPGAPRFFVMLTRYIIAGESYRASGLTVSNTATPILVQTRQISSATRHSPRTCSAQ